MNETSAQLARRIRQQMGANFAAIKADAAWIASQGVDFVLDSSTKTPDPVLYEGNLRGPMESPARPAAVIESITFPRISTGAGGCEVRVQGTMTARILTGVAPNQANVNDRQLRLMIYESLARVAGIEIDGPDDLAQVNSLSDEGESVYVQGFRVRQTTSRLF